MSLESKRKELTDQIKKYKAQVALLDSIVRVKKKDGTDFSSIGKNFTSMLDDVTVKVINESYPIKSIDKSLDIYGRVDGIWVEEKIDITPCVQHTNYEVAEDRIIKEPMVKPYFVMNADEVEKAVNEHLSIVKGWLAKDEEALSMLDELYDIFVPRLIDIKQDLKKCCGDNNTLWYDMIDILKEVIY